MINISRFRLCLLATFMGVGVHATTATADLIISVGSNGSGGSIWLITATPGTVNEGAENNFIRIDLDTPDVASMTDPGFPTTGVLGDFDPSTATLINAGANNGDDLLDIPGSTLMVGGALSPGTVRIVFSNVNFADIPLGTFNYHDDFGVGIKGGTVTIGAIPEPSVAFVPVALLAVSLIRRRKMRA